MDQVDRNGRLPLYHQLYEILHEKSLLKAWKPGDRLPTEVELVDLYGVSRITVRKVLDTLAKDSHQPVGCAVHSVFIDQ